MTNIKFLKRIPLIAGMVSKITDRVLPMVSQWHNRPLKYLYSFIFLDAIHYKVRDEKQIANKAAYGAINEKTALHNFLEVKKKWNEKYPSAIKSVI